MTLGVDRELLQMRVVVRALFGLGHVDATADFALLNLPDENPLAEHLLQLRKRHPFALQRGFERGLGLDLVVFPDRVEHLCELRVADGQRHLFRALHQQHLVDHRDDGLRGDLGKDLRELGIGQAARIGLVLQLAKRRKLNLMELGLGDDFAVHLHEHLLEDLGRDAPCLEPRPPELRSSAFFINPSLILL